MEKYKNKKYKDDKYYDVKYREIFESLHEGIAAMTLNYKFIFSNPAMDKIFGVNRGELIGRSLEEFVSDNDWLKIIAKFEHGWSVSTEDLEIKVINKDDSKNEKKREINNVIPKQKIVNASFNILKTKKGKKLLLGVYRDVTIQKQLKEKREYLTFHDSLTGLYNRSYFEEELKRLNTSRQLPLSVIFVDVNNLKLINDMYGHNVGDKMLKSVARALKNSCRQEDIIARLGGDEFVILLPGNSKEEALIVEHRILKNCGELSVKGLPLTAACGSASKYYESEAFEDTLRKAEEKMYIHKLKEKQRVKSELLRSFFKRLREKSPETQKHNWRMQSLAFSFGVILGLGEFDLVRLMNLSSLHDIGKVVIAEEILKKEKKLTGEEWEMIKKHPRAGYLIALSMEKFMNVAEEILAHHERYDGKGYPRRLKGEKIPILSRIIAIIDAYDVMTEGRPYKKPITEKEALKEIEKNAGTQFDPDLVKIFVSVIEKTA